VRRVDESEVNILTGLELEPLWLVEVKSHRTIAALLLVLSRVLHSVAIMRVIVDMRWSREYSREYKGGGGAPSHVVINESVRPMTIVQE